MRNVLSNGLKWLQEQLREHAQYSLEYRRGSEEVILQASLGRTLWRLSDGHGGTRIEWTERDVVVAAADLVLAGVRTLPQRGDQVRETRGAEVYVYEVLAPGSEPVWRWADPYRMLLRIHTVYVATELL